VVNATWDRSGCRSDATCATGAACWVSAPRLLSRADGPWKHGRRRRV